MTAEAALDAIVDSLYLSGRRRKCFLLFPEIELPASFRIGRARQWAKLVPSTPLRRYVERKLELLWQDARAA